MSAENTLRWIEFLILFIGLPLALCFVENLRPAVLWLMLGFGAACLLALFFDKTFDRRKLYDRADFHKHALWILVRFVPLAAAMWLLAVYLRPPDRIFWFPRNRTQEWLELLAKYVFIFVPMQEIMYRSFFFQRYERLFKTPTAMILVNTLCFSFLHIVYGNRWALLLTLPGGYLFARTYQRTQSLPLVWLEHALFGGFLFSVGLGYYFAFPGRR